MTKIETMEIKKDAGDILAKIKRDLEKEKPREEFYLKGYLEQILEVKNVFEEQNNGIIGSGVRVWHEFSGIETTLGIKQMGKIHKIPFFGLVLPDSIGHAVDIYKTGEHVSAIYDGNLDRWYLNRREK